MDDTQTAPRSETPSLADARHEYRVTCDLLNRSGQAFADLDEHLAQFEPDPEADEDARAALREHYDALSARADALLSLIGRR